MTDEEARIGKLEDKYHGVDKRQESFEVYTRQRQDSFEEFVRGYIDGNEKRIERIEARMDRLETNLTAQMHNLLIAGGVGVATIVATMIAMVAAFR